MTDVLVVGESLVDIVRHADGTREEYPGGSGANVAVALARLRRSTALLTALGDDARGRVLERHFQQSGVALVGNPYCLARTSTALATIAPDGSASYDFDIEWRLPDVPEMTPRAVHACSLGAVMEPGAAGVRQLLRDAQPESTLSYDANVRPTVTGVSRAVVHAVESIASLADLVKASDEDLEALYPGERTDAAVERLRGLGASAVVVTRGGAGATWFGPQGRVEVPAAEVEVADTIGAGDTLSAALLDGLCELGVVGGELDDLATSDIEGLLERAAHAAAIVVSRSGADPPYRHEVD